MKTWATIVFLSLFNSLVSAQVEKIIPLAAAVEGSTATPMITGYGAGRIQQIIDGEVICTNRAVLAKLSLRADGSMLTSLAAKNLSGFQLSLGYTKYKASEMKTRFADNRTGLQTRVYSGNLVLPPQDSRVRPFNIIITIVPFVYERSKGNLLVELVRPGVAVMTPYMLDSHIQSTNIGSSGTFGVAGKLGGAAPKPRLQCEADYMLKPGRSAIAVVSAITKNYPSGIVWGFSTANYGPLQLPFDLGPLGAPGNYLYTSLDLVIPVTLIKSGATYIGRNVLPIPNTPVVLGAQVFCQFFFQDATANALGVVFTEGLALHLQAASMPVQYVQTKDSTSLTGSKGYSGEGLVIRFTGVYQ